MFVEVLEDLKWGNVAVCSEAVFELGVVLFVQRVTEVVSNATEESFVNEPRGTNEFLFFLSVFTLVGERGVGDGGVVGGGFAGGSVCVDASEVVILVST